MTAVLVLAIFAVFLLFDCWRNKAEHASLRPAALTLMKDALRLDGHIGATAVPATGGPCYLPQNVAPS